MLALTMGFVAVMMGSGESAAAIKVSGWMVSWNPTSLAQFEAQASRIHEVLPEWFMVQADGTVARRPGWTPETRARLMKVAKDHGVAVLGMASNFAGTGFDAKRMQVMLGDKAKRDQHAKDLAKMAAEDGLDGIDLDYESLEAPDRENFSRLVEAMAAETRTRRLVLSVTVHAKTSEPGDWGGSQAQDFARLARAADVMRVMTYDQSWSGSAPGPIAADAWVESAMSFAATQIPKEKLEMGIAGYGYDWTKRPATSLTWTDWVDRKGPTLDPASGELVLGESRFSGAESNGRKIALAKRLGLRGVSLWYIGSEEPGLWDAVPKR